MTQYASTLKQATAAHATIQRAPATTANRGCHDRQRGKEVNVGEFERHASMIGGTALAVYGLLSRS